ncbi:hypothetical protein ACFLS7_06930 [Bacteroidota bacterium]
MKKFNLIFLILMVPVVTCFGGGGIPDGFLIVPQPASMKMKSGTFRITNQTMLLVAERDIDLKNVAILFAEQLRLAGGPFLICLQQEEREPPD